MATAPCGVLNGRRRRSAPARASPTPPQPSAAARADRRPSARSWPSMAPRPGTSDRKSQVRTSGCCGPRSRPAQGSAGGSAFSVRNTSTWALEQLRAVAIELDGAHPGAAASLLEGMEETLTVIRLGTTGKLERTLQPTNAIESMISTVRVIHRDVKHWSSGEMCLRWTSAGMLEAETRFRKVPGYHGLANLAIAIETRPTPSASQCHPHLERGGRRSTLIAVGRLLFEPHNPEVCGPAPEQRYRLHRKRARCRCPGRCSARPLSDTTSSAESASRSSPALRRCHGLVA